MFLKHFRRTVSLLAISVSAQAAVNFTLSPASITNDFVGKVTLTITGLSPGQTIRVERFTDANGNGVVDAVTDGLFRTFTVTDGQLPLIGGVRDLNVPGDDDGSVNGQIRIDLDQPGVDNVFGSASGNYIYRISDPAHVFASIDRAFVVAQKAYPQGIRGQLTSTSGGAALAGTFLVLLNGNGVAIGGTVADSAGNYTLNTPPGSYLLVPFYPGHVGGAASAAVTANQFLTNNQTLAATSLTISGRITDAANGSGIAGLSIFAEGDGHFTFSTPTDANGNYSMPVVAGQWRIQPSDSSVAQFGYLRPDKQTIEVTNSSIPNFNFSLTKGNALIYGTVKDNLNNPMLGIQVGAQDQNNAFQSDSTTLPPNGNFTLVALAGSWYVNVESDTLPAGYTAGQGTQVTLTAGQAVQANLVVSIADAHLSGKIVDQTGAERSGLTIQANPQNGGNGPQTVSGTHGEFTLDINAGNWQLFLNSGNENPTNLIGPNLSYTVPSGGQISGINFVVFTTTSRITGILTNSAGSPLEDVGVYATANINGTNYQQNFNTDPSGHYSLGVINGNWQVGVDSYELNSRGYGVPPNQTVIISGGDGVANFGALPPDTTAPLLISSSPANGAVNVSRNAIVSFTFNEPMQSGYSVNWSSNVAANQFAQGWSGDNRTIFFTYNTSLPAGATISWTLNPTGFSGSFRDQAGNALPSNISGSFTTAALTGAGPDVVFYSISKQAAFVQNDGGSPTFDPGAPFIFNANVIPTEDTSVSAASLQSPNAGSQTLSFSSDSHQYGIKPVFSNQTAMDATYPSGNYGLSFTTVHDGAKLFIPTLPATAIPVAPHISNFAALQALNPRSDFLLTWDPFVGGTTGDFIAVGISGQNGNDVFSTADIWATNGLKLNGTATGILIPANTMTVGQAYSLKIQFVKVVTRETTLYPGALGLVAFAAKTKTSVMTTSLLSNPAKLSNGQFQFTVSGIPGAAYRIESTSILSANPIWIAIATNTAVNGSFSFADPAAASVPRTFYRAVLLP